MLIYIAPNLFCTSVSCILLCIWTTGESNEKVDVDLGGLGWGQILHFPDNADPAD